MQTWSVHRFNDCTFSPALNKLETIILYHFKNSTLYKDFSRLTIGSLIASEATLRDNLYHKQIARPRLPAKVTLHFCSYFSHLDSITCKLYKQVRVKQTIIDRFTIIDLFNDLTNCLQKILTYAQLFITSTYLPTYLHT